MDKKELREFIGSTHHYHPEMNPIDPKKKPGWFGKTPKVDITGRQRSLSESSDTSPVGSPTGMTSPLATASQQSGANPKQFPLQGTAKNVYKEFDFK